MADLSTRWASYHRILFLLVTTLVVLTSCEDVHLNFPQSIHVDVQYELLDSNIRHKRDVASTPPPISTPIPNTSTQPAPSSTQPSLGDTTQSSGGDSQPQTSTASNTNNNNVNNNNNNNNVNNNNNGNENLATSPKTPESQTTIQDTTIMDNHNYYTSIIQTNVVEKYWIELTEDKRHKTLSGSHRTAVTIDLNFPFRFYGHNITNVTVATGGFLYTSPFLHQWLTATQYIAPLMANFDTRIGNDSAVYYDNSGSQFIVQWKSIHLQNRNFSQPFEFEVVLNSDGKIMFLYKKVPVDVSTIPMTNHPVKIGLSDAFYIDNYYASKGIRRRTIYEYHRVPIPADKIRSGTVVILDPLPTCNIISNCGQCITHENVEFKCKWCEKVKRCSDGIDWHRQSWLEKGCKDLDDNQASCPKPSPGFPVAAVVAVIVILVLISALGIWLYYAYTHPTTASGMWLLENRPSRMKEKLSKMKFWKKNTAAGTQYAVESTA